ncbi:MAG TPA: hypothetical protein VGE96_00870 [Steroidobacteraceae bacterium]|jgi:hypothetical protein
MTAAVLAQLSAMQFDDPTPQRVVRKGDGGMSEERLTWHLENWAAWQRRADAICEGAPPRAGSGLGRSHRRTFDEMVESADTRCAEAVEAILDDLPPLERFAIHHAHLAAVYRFHHHSARHEDLYASGRAKVKRGLSARGIL